jgi:hypothetical protein
MRCSAAQGRLARLHGHRTTPHCHSNAACRRSATGPPINKPDATQDYLLLSCGQWDPDKSQEEIQAAIDSFYIWYDKRLVDGSFKRGHRLSASTKVVSRAGITDGPFSEAKEVIGGYWSSWPAAWPRRAHCRRQPLPGLRAQL